MGNQPHKSSEVELSHHPNTTTTTNNDSSHHSNSCSTKATLINCFALGDEMIYYLWRFYDCDNNHVLDKNEMRTFLTELIHTLHDVCLRSELMTFGCNSNSSSDTTKRLSGTVNTESFSAPSSPKQASHADPKKLHNSSASEIPRTDHGGFFTSESVSLDFPEIVNSPTPVSPLSEEKKKSRFGFLSRKKKSSASTSRMSVDLSKSSIPVQETQQPPSLKSQNSAIRMQMSSDVNSMKRRSVAVVPMTGLTPQHHLEQMLTGNSQQDEIRIKWRKIKEVSFAFSFRFDIDLSLVLS